MFTSPPRTELKERLSWLIFFFEIITFMSLASSLEPEIFDDVNSDQEGQQTTKNYEDINHEKLSWIYLLTKPELQEYLRCHHIPYEDSARVDDLRKLLSQYCKRKAQKQPVKMTSYTIKIFDGEGWECFEQQLDCLIVLNDVEEAKKVPLLLTKVSPQVLEVLNCMLPKKPTEYSYKQLCDKLKGRYVVKNSLALERANFRSRNQLPTETIVDYELQLRKLGNKCQFTDLDDQIMEKIIDGAYSKQVKFELLKAGDKTLTEILVLARAVEVALGQANIKSETGTEMFYNQKHSNNFKKKFHKPNQKQNGSKIQCFCCGGFNHTRSECRLSKKFCSECGTQGHIFKVCPKNKNHKTYLLKQEQEEDIEETLTGELFNEDEYEIKTVQVRRIPPQYVKLNINNKTLEFQLDTGSDVTVIPLKDKKKFFNNLIVSECKVKFINFDQTVSQPIGLLKDLTVKYKDKSKKLNVFVGHDSMPRILGRDWLDELNLWPLNLANVNANNVDDKLNNKSVSEAELYVKEKFAEVFAPGWGNFKGETIKLKLKSDAKPKCYPVRRVPFALKDKVKSEIKRLVENERIVPIECSEWATPVVPILKSDGSVRLCGDYKVTLNPHLEVDHFPLPHIDEIFNTLKRGKYFCELDLKEAYLQAPLDEASQHLTTIITELGTYKYQYLPYGVSTGPGSFQRLMSNKLSGIPNTTVFIDNIYIAGNSIQDTLETLCKVLTELQKSEFKLKLEKCKFFKTSIEVFGFKITKNDISVIQEHIEPLLKAEEPKNSVMLRSFLGKINYYARFLKNMASILSPLYECTKKDKFVWTEQCTKAFKLIKHKLASTNNLSHYDPSLPLILSCDASHTGIGIALSNRDKNGIIRPIAYASKKFNETEKKYSALDKEAMAIVFGVTKFYNYTYGRPFELETDNSALVRIFGPTKGIPKMAAKRLQHYAIFLSAFNYKIRHIKTSLNPADFLSRTEINVKETDLDLHPICINANTSSINHIGESKLNNLNWKDIQKQTKKDIVLSKVIRHTMDGWPEKETLDPMLVVYYNKREELSVDRDCLFWSYRIVVPTLLRESVLSELHKSHFGTVRMKQLARSFFWWPQLDSEIENITNNCIICLSNSKSPKKGLLQPWPVPPTVWHRIHADFLGPFNNKMYLVIVDSYSKWPEVFQMNSIAAKPTIEAFKSLFSRFGFPVHLVTDNGPTFTSSEFEEYCKCINVKHTFSPPYHPSTNGLAERFVETFKSHIKKIKESGSTITSAINLFLSDYRNMPHSTTGVTPAKLMLGRELRTRFSLFRPPAVTEKSYEMSEKQIKYSSGHRKVHFTVGNKVMVKDYRKNNKTWVQGVIVSESIPNVTYNIDVGGSIWKRHVNQMMNCDNNLELYI